MYCSAAVQEGTSTKKYKRTKICSFKQTPKHSLELFLKDCISDNSDIRCGLALLDINTLFQFLVFCFSKHLLGREKKNQTQRRQNKQKATNPNPQNNKKEISKKPQNHLNPIFNTDLKGIIPTPPRRWHCLLHNTVSSRDGCLALFATTLLVLLKPLLCPHTLTDACHPSSRSKSQKWSVPFQTCCHVLHSLVSSSPLEPHSPIAKPLKFPRAGIEQWAPYFACPILLVADSNEAHRCNLS